MAENLKMLCACVGFVAFACAMIYFGQWIWHKRVADVIRDTVRPEYLIQEEP